MIDQKTNELKLEHHFDEQRCRHSLNNTVYVLHCHHYATLYSQLADDAKDLGGAQLLRQAAELSFHPQLKELFVRQDATDIRSRVTVIEEYWRSMGMGLLSIQNVGTMSAFAVMKRSHVDEGWIKKWGKRDEPVNFIGQGYLNASLAVLYELPPGSFSTIEEVSIVSGAEASRFTIVRAH